MSNTPNTPNTPAHETNTDRAIRYAHERAATPPRTIDYALMRRESPKLKSKLTRATRSGDARKVIAAAADAVAVWDRVGAWPDNWSHWQRAVDDALARHNRDADYGDALPYHIDLDDIAAANRSAEQ